MVPREIDRLAMIPVSIPVCRKRMMTIHFDFIILNLQNRITEKEYIKLISIKPRLHDY